MSTERELCNELEQFCKTEGLPYQSADELLAEQTLNTRQRAWLEAFCEEWDIVMNTLEQTGTA